MSRPKLILTLLAALATVLLSGCRESAAETDRYFIGTNLWYGPILGGTSEGADRVRLASELDSLKAIGITNLRVLVGADGADGIDVKVSPVFHTAPGVYDAGLEEGLSYFLAELEKRDMKAVLYLNNAWEWSGGYGSYLEWAGGGATPNTRSDGYVAYMNHVSRFITSELAQRLFFDHVRYIVGKYKDSKAVYSWQIANEPRCFSSDSAVQDAFVDFIRRSAALIKSVDPAHMVSIGSEGEWGCENSMNLYERLASCPDVDYLTIHIWPYNWSWVTKTTLGENLDKAIKNTDDYIDAHLKLARRLGKKVVIEEFGFPRDGFQFAKGSPTTARDAYYDHIFKRVVESARCGGELLGANFWGWGGFASQNPEHIYWEKGDDYCGDPSQEEQGLNSVYMDDSSTIELIKSACGELAATVSVVPADPRAWLITDSGKASVSFKISSPVDAIVNVKLCFVSDTTLMGSRDTVASAVINKRIQAGCTVTAEASANLNPGFYQVCTSVGSDVCDGFDIEPFNIGVSPEKIVSEKTSRDDFDEFWSSTLSELAAVPVEPQMELMPDRSTAGRNVYRVTYKSFGGVTAGGILVIPTAEGKYPAYIEYMGYGADVYPYGGDDRPDAVQFLVSVRDQGIFRDCKPGENGGWIDRGLASKEEFYYRGAFCDAVRAVDFVASLSCVDSTRIFGQGESQGGAFTWIAASLDRRFRAIAPAVPFLSDYEDYGKIVWWPMHEMYGACVEEGISKEDLLDMLTYFDVKNFTDRIECPVMMAFGLQDPTCPPHTNFAGYNMVKADKSYRCEPLCGHGMWEIKGWAEARDAWFASFDSKINSIY